MEGGAMESNPYSCSVYGHIWQKGVCDRCGKTRQSVSDRCTSESNAAEELPRAIPEFSLRPRWPLEPPKREPPLLQPLKPESNLESKSPLESQFPQPFFLSSAFSHRFPLIGHGHQWDGCICRRCAETRSEGHVLDGCTCNLCGDVFHKLSGCTCTRCRTTIHRWEGCTCVNCGAHRDQDHEWVSRTEFTKCICPYNGYMNTDRTNTCTWCQGVGSRLETIVKCEKCGKIRERSTFETETKEPTNKCWACGGTGKVICFKCGGTGSLKTITPGMYQTTTMTTPCYFCGRTGRRPCDECHGSGHR